MQIEFSMLELVILVLIRKIDKGLDYYLKLFNEVTIVIM